MITNPGQAPVAAEQFREYVQAPLLTHIKLDFGGFEAYDVEPAGVPDVFAERPVTVFGKWRGKPTGKIILQGLSGDQTMVKTIDVSGVEPLPDNAALSHLWARARLAQLSDDNHLQPNDRRISEITDLALKYNLLTAYTSFIAVDTEVRRLDGEVSTVIQPLPLPEGVSDYAVGGMAQATSRMLSAPALPAAESMKSKGAASQLDLDQADKRMNVAKEEDSKESQHKEGTTAILRLGKMTVSGSLSEQEVRKIVEHNLEAMRSRCLGLQEGAGAGELPVEWVIDSRGQIKEVKIGSHQISREGLESCLTAVMKTWRFPASSKSSKVGETKVSVLFLFGKKGSD